VYDKLRLLLAASCCYNGVGCAPALERTMGGGAGWIKYPNTAPWFFGWLLAFSFCRLFIGARKVRSTDLT